MEKRAVSSTAILVVEDDDAVADPLVRALKMEGYAVNRVARGQRAIDALSRDAKCDVVVLELNLPDMSGLDVCKAARAGGFDGGIVILSEQADEVDVVVGLDLGADDYLAKPIRLAELQARIRALGRRVEPGNLALGLGLHLDVAGHRVLKDDVEVPVSAKEFGILALFLSPPDAVVTRTDLMTAVWGADWYGSPKALDVTIARLRKKLRDAGVRETIVSVRGVGFRLQS